MVEFSGRQKDALAEVVNLGMGRAAASLSRLTGDRVLLEAPRVEILSLAQLDEHLAEVADQDVCGVLQVFEGEVGGDAILFLPLASARNLLELLVGRPMAPSRFSELEQAALMEVGNIVINACLGSLSNLLETRFSFLVPHVAVQGLRPMLMGNGRGEDPGRLCLLVESRFRVKSRAVDGFLAIVVGVDSARALASALDRLLDSTAGREGG